MWVSNVFLMCVCLVAPARHPLLQHDIDADMKLPSAAMALSEAQWLALVPDKPSRAACDCPNCYGGSQGINVFDWSVDRPDEMKCKTCGTVFPNDRFPEDQQLTGKNARGETIVFQYHFNEEKNIRHYLSASLAHYRRQWLVEQCLALAKAHHVTGDEAYARRVIIALVRIAQVYPHYPIMRQWQQVLEFSASQQPPLKWDAGQWGRWRPAEIPEKLGDAYDLVYDRATVGQRQRIESDFFRPTIEAVMATPDHTGNLSAYYLSRAVRIGRTIGEPRYVHWGLHWMQQTIRRGCYVDGAWHESPWYHAVALGGLKWSFRNFDGYSDPPGYVDNLTGRRIDGFDLERDVPLMARCLNAPGVLDDANGAAAVIHDTFAHKMLFTRTPKRRTASAIMPAFGHAALGRGEGYHQLQAHLHFSGSHGHAHYDNLNLAIWGKGREMISDLGYTLSQMRYWTTCTAGHNTVVIDRSDQSITSSGDCGTDCDLLWYFPDVEGVAVVEADGRRGYATDGKGVFPTRHDVTRYRRMLVAVPVSDEDAYIIDIFRVRGGSAHDWLLHGDADHDMSATCSLPLMGKRKWMLESFDEWREPDQQWAPSIAYGMMRDLASAKTDGSFNVTFRYVDRPDAGIRTRVFAGDGAEVFLGRSPSVRRTGDNDGADGHKVYDFWMPQLIVRRGDATQPLSQTHYGFHAPPFEGSEPLSSVFVAVHEPFDGAPMLESVEVAAPHEGAISIRIRHNGKTDTVVSTPDPRRLEITRQTPAGKSRWLFEDSDTHRGRIIAATRRDDGATHDALITDALLPTDGKLDGLWMIVTHGNGYTHGYEIDRVEEQDGRRRVILAHDHGLVIESKRTREVFFPHRTIEGTNAFTIPMSTSMNTGP